MQFNGIRSQKTIDRPVGKELKENNRRHEPRREKMKKRRQRHLLFLCWQLAACYNCFVSKRYNRKWNWIAWRNETSKILQIHIFAAIWICVISKVHPGVFLEKLRESDQCYWHYCIENLSVPTWPCKTLSRGIGCYFESKHEVRDLMKNATSRKKQQKVQKSNPMPIHPKNLWNFNRTTSAISWAEGSQELSKSTERKEHDKDIMENSLKCDKSCSIFFAAWTDQKGKQEENLQH